MSISYVCGGYVRYVRIKHMRHLSVLQYCSNTHCKKSFKKSTDSYMLTTHVVCMVCRLVLDFNMIRYAFGDFPLVMWLWVRMTLSVTLLVFPVFQYWSYNRKPGPVSKYIYR